MTTDKLMQMLSHHDAVMLLFFGKSMTLENLRLITEPYKLDIKITAKRKSNIIGEYSKRCVNSKKRVRM